MRSEFTLSRRPGGLGSGSVLAPAARHLALACRTLSLRAAIDPAEAERFKAAEARFRALADATPAYEARALAASPIIASIGRKKTYLAELLDDIGGWALRTSRSVDPDLVDGACDLLQGVAWSIPERKRRRPEAARAVPPPPATC